MSDSDRTSCPICLFPAVVDRHPASSHHVDCWKCGRFAISSAIDEPHLDPRERANASGFLRENPDYHLAGAADLDRLRALTTPSVGEKAIKLLREFERIDPVPGRRIHFLSQFQLAYEEEIKKGESVEYLPKHEHEVRDVLRLMGAAWCYDGNELHFLASNYLARTKGWLEVDRNHAVITGEGWEWLYGQRGANLESPEAFVAMWFDNEVEPAFDEAIDPAVREAGFLPFRIDRHEHNNMIDDEIIAAIRRSRFLVADFTGHRPGVYFEAGLAMGLDKPVIWLVRDDHLNACHFDTRQYNHIVWSAENLADLKTNLFNRIAATIGVSACTTTS